MPRPSLTAAAVSLLLVPLGAQTSRDIATLTATSDTKSEARISPDGNWVAFRGASRLGVVPFSGGSDVNLITGPNLGDFVWAATSSGVYYLENSQVRFVSRTGTSGQLVGTIPGQSARLWCVTDTDTYLYGTRYDPVAFTYVVFRLKTDGTTAAQDLLSSAYLLDAVRYTPARGGKILYRSQAIVPFAPREYFRADANGANPVSITGGAILGQPDFADFTDGGDTIAFSWISTVSNTAQLASFALGQTAARALTDKPKLHRRSAVSEDRLWIAHEAQLYVGGPMSLGIVPADGGGVVLLDPTRTFIFNGPPSVSRAGTRIAFTGLGTGGTVPQVHGATLDRELRVRPRVEAGQPFTVELPAIQGELGGAFFSASVLGTPVTLPGFHGAFALDPLTLIQVLSGTGSGTDPLRVTIPVPGDPSLVGQEFYLQGARYDLPRGVGDFTRYAAFQVF